ncbi:MAG TPA: patatin-like phospholipase family protein [Gammaproteobacteria bacterium]
MHGKDHPQAGFATVLAGELDLLEQLRSDTAAPTPPADDPGVAPPPPATVYARAHAAQLSGLAFSGGGIRSATFNLGILQALARTGMLGRFDYLSTVSGGGYIGGWLSAFLHRQAATDGVVDQAAVERFQALLKTHPSDSGMRKPDDTTGFPPVENVAVRYLRRYSNYLTPRLGLSGDMLAAISIFLRNLTLIQFSLITLLAGLLITAHVLVAWSAGFAAGVPTPLRWLEELASLLGWGWPFVGAALALFIAVWFTGRLLSRRGISPQDSGSAGREVFVKIILPCTVAGWWFATGVTSWPDELRLTELGPIGDFGDMLNRSTGNRLGDTALDALLWVLCATGAYALAWGLGFVATRSHGSNTANSAANAGDDIMGGGRPLALLIAGACAGAVLGLLLFAAARHVSESATVIDIWYAVAFGTPLFLLGLSFVVTVHIGVARRQFSEHDREWWARLGGLVLLCAGAWTLIFVLVIYATPFVHWLAGGGPAALGAWAGGSGLGAWLARSPSTGTPGAGGWKELVTRMAPWLFVIGLTIIVAHITHIALLDGFTEQGYVRQAVPVFGTAVECTLQRLHELTVRQVFVAWIGIWLLFALVSWRFDINLFSLHALYSNRLTRAFLGASHAGRRQPNPFTGFDPFDDVLFHALSTQRPIPLINTAINMTGGDDLAWQTRRSTSFTFTPCWSGFETRSTQGKTLGSYCPTNRYAGGLHLGTLIAVSGAAASPNMGYHTSPAVSALLTAFNLRLGRWCGNPAHPGVWELCSPRFAAKPILAELTGSATAQADWINLTDGGHFENLGVYELVRRRCRFVLVTDAGCDPNHEFEDLANLIRKCWTDFGVDIRFESFDPMHRKGDSRYSSCHGAVGHIRYPDGPDGILLYLKCALTGDELPDIRQYADAHKEFPHETTADQYFDENQFEAYRHLGYHIAASAVAALEAHCGAHPRDLSMDELSRRLQRRI